MKDQISIHDLTAEAAVLGAWLLDPESIDVARAILSPAMFWSESHRIIAETIATMRDVNRKIDVITVGEAIEKAGQLERVGGGQRLAELMAAVPITHHTDHYAEIVRDRYRRRLAEAAGRKVISGAHDLTTDTEAVLSDAESAIHQAIEGGAKETATDIDSILIELMSPEGQSKIAPIPTGWATLDALTGGVTPGQLIILAARTSIGKSAAAATLMRRMAESDEPALFVSYEMSRLEVAERLMLGALNVDCWTFRRAHGNRQLQSEILQQAEILGKLPITIDESKPSLPQLQAMMRLQVRRRKVRIVIVDYLQLVPFVGKAGNREQEIAQITRQLKAAAGQLGVAIIALSQLNRDVEKRESHRPRLSDLRESGAIEQDADQVWLLWRPNLNGGNAGDEPDNIGELIVAKQRGGQLGVVPLSWDGPTMTYRDRSEIPGCVHAWGSAS